MMTEIIQIQNLTKEELLSAISDLIDSKLSVRKVETSVPTRYSIKELAEQNPVCEQTIRNWIKEGKLKAEKIGRRIFIEESEFEKALSQVKSLNYKR
ncbi:helix-turn-helix domain-containing protein [Leeuwenhoekiella sp. NPDC079379]|uniref:helix-turn-helix domain-containing protein n=1 Tax=Leeuwenhoekiella sp. NPDC079379 TaxID=3364122 RepID=UPI0037C85705